MSKTKFQKQRERRKKIERERNLRKNKPNPPFILSVETNSGWLPVKKFSNAQEVNAHILSIEELRKRNASDIVEARILNTRTGEVQTIKGHKMSDPALIGKSLETSGKQEASGDNTNSSLQIK